MSSDVGLSNLINDLFGGVVLQICSGKLFQNDIEYRNNLRGVIYTNLKLFGDEKIETQAGVMLPTSSLGASTAIVYELEELVESTGNPDQRGILISSGVDSYISDFSAILSFALNCTASTNYELTNRLISDQKGLSTLSKPKDVVKQVFNKEIFCQPHDIEHLTSFTNQLIGLERKVFLGVMRAIRTYVTAMHRIADDLELAYTLLVASLESITQDFDNHKITWQDFDEKKRKTIDLALAEASESTSNKVKDALTKGEYASIARRFNSFSINHVKPSFYRDEAIGVINPISKLDLPKALSNAYKARSGYVHSLQKLPTLLVHSVPHSDTCRIKNSTWLTIQGLSRLTRHIITNFVYSQGTVEREKYNYHLERTGIIQAPLAPQYWLNNMSFYEGSGNKKLEGFLNQLAECTLSRGNAQLTDIREMLTAVEGQYHDFKNKDKRPYAALYTLFNGVLSDDEKMKGSNRFTQRVENTFLKPSPEALILNLLFCNTPDWTVEQHYECLHQYLKTRDNKNCFRMPSVYESGMVLDLAERYRLAGNIDVSLDLITLAVENHPDHENLRHFEAAYNKETQTISWREIMFPKKEE
ncbi:hypothetical protein [Shewanella colwelliana]|uniref:hypothetical protein n=1 Tax=Shewanella colwelliana TaxID=23 RepID=UPI0022B05E9A|nr:hypothetical protein [Shewanella colwelliana]MCZ4336400.1 hypothetical protein [Shewanella colwelliana]